MEETIKKAMPSLIVVAIVSLITAIWRFESVAGEVKKLKSEMQEHYTKKTEFVVVKNDLKHIKEEQSKQSFKMDKILEEIRRR